MTKLGKRVMLKRYLTVLVLNILVNLSTTFLASAQVPGVKISVEPENIYKNESFNLIVEFEGIQSATRPKLLEAEDIELLGQSQNSSINIINGQISQKSSYQFTLIATETGKIKLPDIQIETNQGEQILQSPTIEVLANDTANSKPNDNSRDQDGQKGKLKYYQGVSEVEVYQGEQVTNALTINSPYEITSVDIGTLNYADFWMEKLDDDQISSRPDGRQFIHSYSTRRSLYPLKAGVLTIPEREVKLSVIEPIARQDPFDLFSSFPFMSGRPRTAKLNSNSLEIQVKPLPSNIPANAINWGNSVPLVGDTELYFEPDNNPIKIKSSKSYKLVIKTYGNANPIKKLPWSEIQGAQFYEEPVKVRKNVKNGKLQMELSFHFSIVPTQPGNLQAPAIALSYFDTTERRFITLNAKAIDFEVLGADGQKVISNQQNNEHANFEPKIQDSENQPSLKYTEETFWEEIKNSFSFGFLVWICSLFISLLLLLYWLIKKLKQPHPLKQLKHKLRNVNDLQELKSVLYDIIKTVTGLNVDSYTCSQLAEQVKYLNFSPEVVYKLQNILDQLEQLQYSQHIVTSKADFIRLQRDIIELLKIL